MKLPSIALVVPTHGRADLVEELMISLDVARKNLQELGGKAEIILVDSSDRPDALRIAELCALHAITLLRGPNNVRQKRNMGISASAAELIVFTDSDCRVDPDFLTGHASAAAHSLEDVAGFIGVTRFYGEQTWAWRAAFASPFLDSFTFAERYPRVEWGPFTNLSIRRRVFAEVGGFVDHWNYRLGADDVEFGRRITRNGAIIQAIPEVTVWHSRATWSRWCNVLSRANRWGATDAPLRLCQPREHLKPRLTGPIGAVILALPISMVSASLRRSTVPLLGVPIGFVVATAIDSLERRKPQPDAILGSLLRSIFEGRAAIECARVGRPIAGISEIAPDSRARKQDRLGRHIRSASAVIGGLTPLYILCWRRARHEQ